MSVKLNPKIHFLLLVNNKYFGLTYVFLNIHFHFKQAE
jgi:hypothetical protein